MNAITYAIVMDVETSWSRMKSVPNYQEVASTLIFERVFELEPEARALFHFTQDQDLKSDPRFFLHAQMILDMIDMAVGFLGPDLEPLQQDLNDLGRKHAALGIKSSHLPVMERAVMYALEELLDRDFTKEDRKSWQTVFHFMITAMIKGMQE